MAIATPVGQPTRWWEWKTVNTESQLDRLPVDCELRDATGITCRAAGVGVAPPSGWMRTDTGRPYTPQLPAKIL